MSEPLATIKNVNRRRSQEEVRQKDRKERKNGGKDGRTKNNVYAGRKKGR